ncbi:MAG: hypothetical protein ABIA37_03505 [Candidatus Woesearchaeota archaeon]
MVTKKIIAGSVLLGALLSYNSADAKTCVPDGKHTVKVEAVEAREQKKSTYKRGGPMATALKRMAEEQGCAGKDLIQFLLRGNSRALGKWQQENKLTAEHTIGEDYTVNVVNGKVEGVEKANHPPFFPGKPVQKLSPLGDLEAVVVVEDKDKNELYLKAGSSGPGGQPLDLKYHVLESKPGYLKARFSAASLLPGNYNIEVEAHDGKGGKDKQTILVRVEAPKMPAQTQTSLPQAAAKLEEKVEKATIDLDINKSASAYVANKVLTDFDGEVLVYVLTGFQKDLPKGFSLAANLGYRYDSKNASSSSLFAPTITREALPETQDMYKVTEERSTSNTIDQHHDFVFNLEAAKQIIGRYLQAGVGVEGIVNDKKTIVSAIKRTSLQNAQGQTIGEPKVFENYETDHQGKAIRTYFIIKSCFDWKTRGVQMGVCAGGEGGAEFDGEGVRPTLGVRSAYRINF